MYMQLIKRKSYEFWNYRDTRKETFPPLRPPVLPPVETNTLRPVTGLISHHILLPLAELPEPLVHRLKADLTFRNPEFEKAREYGKGFVSYAIPEFVRFYAADTTYLGLPRSVKMTYLHNRFRDCGLELHLQDIRPEFERLTWRARGEIKPRFYQEEAIRLLARQSMILKFQCGRGKCVDQNSLVSCAGRIRRISSIVQENEKTCIQTMEGCHDTGFFVDNGWKRSAEIITRTGFRICGTTEHPVYVFNGYYFYWKKLRNVEVGDTIVCTSLQLSETADVPISFSPTIKKGAYNVKSVKIPQTAEPWLARLAGYLVGDGCTSHTLKNHIKFTTADPDVLKDFKDLVTLFGIEIRKVKTKKYDYAVSSMIFKQFLAHMGVKEVLAGKKGIPEFAMASQNHAVEFIRGYMESDGWVEKELIGCCSKSKRLIYDLKTLLFALGIFSSINKKTVRKGRHRGNVYYNLIIRSSYFLLYQEKIGFISTRKRESLVQSVKSVPESHYNSLEVYNVQHILKDLLSNVSWGFNTGWSNYTSKAQNPIGKKKLREFVDTYRGSLGSEEIFQPLAKIVDRNLTFDTVASKRYTVSHMYDINVPAVHNYVANSIVCHNTTMALLATARVRLKTLVIVRTRILLRQWIEAIQNIYDVHEDEIGVISGGIKRHGAITVATEQSLINLSRDEKRELGESYGTVIVDEVHECGAPTYTELLQYFKAKKMWGLSATPYREDKMDPVLKLYIGQIVEIDDLGEFETRIYLRKTNFRYHFEGKKDKYHELIRALIHNHDRNHIIVTDVQRFVLEGRLVVVYSNRIEHMEILERMVQERMPGVRTDILASRKNGVTLTIEDQERVREYMRSGQLDAVAGGKIIEQGFDCPPLEVAILATPTKSKRLIEQVLGRCQREYLGKKEAILVDYIDEHVRILLYQFYSKNRNLYKKYWKVYD